MMSVWVGDVVLYVATVWPLLH